MKILKYLSTSLLASALCLTIGSQSAFCSDQDLDPEAIKTTPSRELNLDYEALPSEKWQDIFSFGPFRALRLACMEFKELTDKATNSLNLEYSDNPDCLRALLASVEPSSIFCCFDDFNAKQQQIVVSTPGLRKLEVWGMLNSVIPNITSTLQVLKITGLEYTELPFIVQTLPHLNFSHLSRLETLDLTIESDPRSFELNLNLLPRNIEKLKVLNRCNYCPLRNARYGISHPEAFRNLSRLQELRLPSEVHNANFSDLEQLNCVSLQVLDISGCPDIVNYTHLSGMTELRKLKLHDFHSGQRPELPELGKYVELET